MSKSQTEEMFAWVSTIAAAFADMAGWDQSVVWMFIGYSISCHILAFLEALKNKDNP